MRLQYLRTESLRSFFECVKETREKQKRFFATRADEDLQKAKKYEKMLDQFISYIEKVERQ